MFDGLVLLLVLFYLADKLQWPLLLEKSTPAGGDMASHYPTAVYLKNVLLPQGRLIGWYPGNFCGFPLFQFYFPLPFLCIVLLSYIVPMEISFKLVSVLGIFLLPVCSYWSMRLARGRFPVPVLAALFSLAFLFSEGNSMWGGNILSNLAGEFGFQISFSLSVLFIFSVYRHIRDSRYVIANGLLLAIIGLCHGVGLIFAVLVPTFFLIHTLAGIRERLLYLLRVYGLALGFMAFWFFPFLTGSRWSTKLNFLWHFSGLKEVFPIILWPFLAAAVIGTLILTAVHFYWKKKKKKKGQFPDDISVILYIWFAILISAVLFETAYELNVTDIRFLPYVEYLPLLIAAVIVGTVSRHLKGTPMFVLIILLSVGVWVNHHETSVKSWARWNYTGFEGKEARSDFYQINRFLKGDLNDPRVVYEHSPKYNRFGTIRAFENLPHFSGRSTLEGLYVQSSITAPFVFFLQSEISSISSNPLPQYDYSSTDIHRALDHFRLFNIGHFIAASDTIKSLAATHPALEKAARFDDIEIFSVDGQDSGYVLPLLNKPFRKERTDWRRHAYQWFRQYDGKTPHILYTGDADDQSPMIADLPEFTTWQDLPPNRVSESLPRVQSRMTSQTIAIDTTRPGHPLLVKVSYHPGWRCHGADGPYLISPAFMMIIPNREHVTMVFERSAAEWMGIFVSAATLLICVLRRFRPIGWLLYKPWKIKGMDVSSKSWKYGVIVFWISAICLVAFYTFYKRTNSPERLKQRGMHHYSSGELDAAIPVFAKMLKISPDTSYGDDANYFLALSHWRKKDYQKTIKWFTHLVQTYPESEFVPEGLFHIMKSEMILGNKDKGRQIAEQLRENFPGNKWTRYAKQYVKDHS